MSENEPDRCMRAAEAAIQVVREECSGMDVEIREIGDGMFMEIPSDVAEMLDGAGNSPVPMENFSEVIDQSGFIRSWIAGIVASEDIEADPSSSAYANRVFTFAESVFDDPLGFTAEDLVGSPALQSIASEA